MLRCHYMYGVCSHSPAQWLHAIVCVVWRWQQACLTVYDEGSDNVV